MFCSCDVMRCCMVGHTIGLFDNSDWCYNSLVCRFFCSFARDRIRLEDVMEGGTPLSRPSAVREHAPPHGGYQSFCSNATLTYWISDACRYPISIPRQNSGVSSVLRRQFPLITCRGRARRVQENVGHYPPPGQLLPPENHRRPST